MKVTKIMFPTNSLSFEFGNHSFTICGIVVKSGIKCGETTIIPIRGNGEESSCKIPIHKDSMSALIAALTPSEEPIYVLFGQDAVSVFETDGLKGLVKAMRKDEACTFGLQEFPANAKPKEILYATDGWNGYVFLTKKEYKKLQSL